MSYAFIILLLLTCIITEILPAITSAEEAVNTQPAAETIPAAKVIIHLISSSSQYDEKVIDRIKTIFSQQGFLIDTTYLDQKPTPLGYVNTDECRAKTLINALSDNSVSYLWFVRGGAGALNLYPWLYTSQKQISASSPKILIEFSDVTAIHHYINNAIG